MTPKAWKSCFGVFCLLVPGTVGAAKISFSDKGFVDVGALIQAQYRIEQDGAATGKDPSNDFLLRRARLIISGQYDEHIGFLVDTEVSYGTGATGFNNSLFLLDAVATYRVGKEFILDAGLMLLPYSHDSMTGGGKYGTVNNFPSYFSPNSQRGTRDVGVGIRGLLFDDRLYYRLGIFNGVQTSSGAAGLNPGDAPRFAGMLRFNFAGKEDGYAFCQVCFASTPIISLGASSDYQANAIRATAATSPTTATSLGLQQFWVLNGDFFADIPFGSDVELSTNLQFTHVIAGDDTGSPVQSGIGFFGMLAVRFGIFGPYFQFEYFKPTKEFVTILKDATTGATTTYGGNLVTYRAGFSLYLAQHAYKITAEIAFQDRERAGETVTFASATPPPASATFPANHWVGTLQFQAAF